MTGERHPIKQIWLERASAGFLREGTTCPKTNRMHKLAENKSGKDVSKYCSSCLAGTAPVKQREEISKDITTKDSDLRVACWMCGGAFSRRRTKDEYLQQMCAVCLTICERAGLVKLEDPRTRDIGSVPPFQATIV